MSEPEKCPVDAIKAIAEHCRELEELLLYILDEGLTKEAYKRIGECLKEPAKSS
jgi:hypothetical protein